MLVGRCSSPHLPVSSVSMAPVMLSRSSTSVMLRTHVDGDTSARLQLGNYTPQLHAPDDCEGDIHAAGDDMAPVPGALHPRPVLSAECLAVRMSFARCQTHRGVPQSTAQWQYRVRYGAAHRVHKAQVWPNVVSADSNVEHVEDQDRDVVSAHQVHAAHCAGANEEVSQSAVLCSGGVGSVL